MLSKQTWIQVIIVICMAIAINAAVARPWVPTDVTNSALVAWFDANDASTLWADTNATTSATAAVARWDDKSGNGSHAIQTSGSLQADYDSGNKELYFDNGDIFKVTNDPFDDLQYPTAFVVARWNGYGESSYNNHMVGFSANTVGWSFGNGFSDNLHFRLSDWGNFLIFGDRPQPLTNDFVGVGFREDATDNAHKRVNGTITRTESEQAATIDYGTADNRSAIGGSYNGDNWSSPAATLDGWLKEVIVLNNATEDEVETVEGYLAWKWGLEGNLPGGHPFKTEPPPEIPTGVILSNDSVSTNAAPGTLVGTFSYDDADEYVLSGTHGSDFLVTETNELRIADWVDQASYDITVTAYSNSTELVASDFTISATSADRIAFKVSAEMKVDPDASELVGTLASDPGYDEGTSFTIVGGRDDLIQITDFTNLTQVAGSDTDPVGGVHYVEIKASNAGISSDSYLLIGATVVSGIPQGSIFMFR